MLVRSTGLGRTELEGDVKTLETKGDYLIIGVKTTEPVKWHVRVGANFSDLVMITKLLLFTKQGWKFIVSQLWRSFLRIFNKGLMYERPDDF